MLAKSLTNMRTSLLFMRTFNTNNMFSVRNFSAGSRTYQSGMFPGDGLKDKFEFPKHKEFLNDMYYQQEDDDTGKGPFGTPKNDYVDPNQPFKQEAPFVPGGILATYKKRLGITPEDIMQQDYWD